MSDTTPAPESPIVSETHSVLRADGTHSQTHSESGSGIHLELEEAPGTASVADGLKRSVVHELRSEVRLPAQGHAHSQTRSVHRE